MTRPFFRTLGGAASALVALSLTTAPVWAATFIYPDDVSLQDIPNPNGFPDPLENSVAPTGSDVEGLSPSVSGNKVIVNSGGTAPNYVFGAVDIEEASHRNTITNNEVIINGATVNMLVTGGLAETVTNNSVTVNGGTVGGVAGGFASLIGYGSPTVTGNSVTINDNSDIDEIAGGLARIKDGSGSATASNNKVTISGLNIEAGTVFGGRAESADGPATASGNSVAVSGDAEVKGRYMGLEWIDGLVTGGYAESNSGSATASNNTVTISDYAEVEDVFGGTAAVQFGNSSATTSGNKVTISGLSIVDGSVTGGFAGIGDDGDGVANASNNSVTVSGDAETGSVTGGFADVAIEGTATASNNSIAVGGDAETGSVTGGDAEVGGDGNATASNNSITISGDAATGYVTGGDAKVGGNGNAAASNNSVTVSGDAKTGSVTGGDAEVGGNGNATASNNSITISGDAKTGYVTGGLAGVDGDGNAIASNNKVTISGDAQVDDVYGGDAYSNEGNATASNNTVTISGEAQVDGDVYGGYADSDGAGMSGDANNNKVTISGNAKVDRDVYGGFSLIDGYGETGSATGNIVTISGAADLANSNVYGGFVGDTVGSAATGMDAFTGNTLNVLNYNGSSVQSVQNFQYYNFIFPVTQGTDPVLTVTGSAVLGDGNSTNPTIISANTFGNTAPLRPGTSVSLIDAGSLLDNGLTPQATGQHGATLSYLWDLETTSTTLTATVARVQAAPQAKVLSEGFLAGMALVNQGADLVARQGMRDAMRAGQESEHGLGIFGAFSGGWSRYSTGSHVELSSFSLLTGLSRSVDINPGRLTVGAFFEYGNGSYDTYNAFSAIGSVNGDGDVHHIGGGIVGRLDFATSGPGHAYTEASFRAGSVSNEYSNSRLRDLTGRSAGGYDVDSAYYGLHAGLGYIWNLGDGMSLDLYGKYFWTRVEGDDVTLATGEPVTFKDADSHRVRIGSRFSYEEDECFTPYVGVAYEHEFDGKARATTYGYAINPPDLAGGTGIGEVGMHIKPDEDLPMFIDLGMQGYVGTRRGLTGSVQLKFEF